MPRSRLLLWPHRDDELVYWFWFAIPVLLFAEEGIDYCSIGSTNVLSEKKYKLTVLMPTASKLREQ